MIASCHATGWFRVFLLVTLWGVLIPGCVLAAVMIAYNLREIHRWKQRR